MSELDEFSYFEALNRFIKKSVLLIFVMAAMAACSNSAKYQECLEISSKSTPLASVPICAKKYQEKLGKDVLVSSKATWDNWRFTLKELKVQPGYAITRLKIRVREGEDDKGEILDIPVFYLPGYPLSYLNEEIKTKLKPREWMGNWSFTIVEVWGVNTLD